MVDHSPPILYSPYSLLDTHCLEQCFAESGLVHLQKPRQYPLVVMTADDVDLQLFALMISVAQPIEPDQIEPTFHSLENT